MPFLRGESYTRNHIYDQVGGEKVSFLPQKDGRIVCGCFSPASNPEAPYLILVGGDEAEGNHVVERKARILEKQDEPIPVFLKRGSNDWVFQGYFGVQRARRDRRCLDEKQRRAGRDDVVMALLMEEVESSADTYLLTWNPNNWPWDDLEAEVLMTAEGRHCDSTWSCGNTKRILPGDRVFLLRQGKEPRGIMAAGWATSNTYPRHHRDPERRAKGDKALTVGVRFERILHPELDEILPVERLKDGPLASVNWSTPASGIRVKQGAGHLERLWAEHLRIFSEVSENGAVEGTIRVALARHRAR